MISNSLKRRRIERLSKNEISQKSCKSWLIFSTNCSAMLCFDVEIYKARSIEGSGAPPPPSFSRSKYFFLKLPILNRFIVELYPPPTHTIWGITNMGGGWGITHLTNASSPLPALPRIRICRKSENAYSCYISVIKKTLS